MNLRKAIKKIMVSISLALLTLTGSSIIALGALPVDALAIKGYDTVAYFKEGKALKGSADYSFKWHDKIWYFSTINNKNLFAADPVKYAPQYDGYCAWAMTQARKAETDPEVWKIFNGKLYLNCSRQAHEKWSRDIPGNIKRADENWKLLHKKD